MGGAPSCFSENQGPWGKKGSAPFNHISALRVYVICFLVLAPRGKRSWEWEGRGPG